MAALCLRDELLARRAEVSLRMICTKVVILIHNTYYVYYIVLYIIPAVFQRIVTPCVTEIVLRGRLAVGLDELSFVTAGWFLTGA